jgi:hypothetical protein
LFKKLLLYIFDTSIKRPIDYMYLIIDVITRKNKNKLTDIFTTNKDEIIKNIVLFENDTGQIVELHKKTCFLSIWLGMFFCILLFGVGPLVLKFNIFNLLSITYFVILIYSTFTLLLFNRIKNYVNIVRKEIKRTSCKSPKISK